MRNTVFIFGAGASFDCINLGLISPRAAQWQPPLADQILGECFDKVVERHPGQFTSLSDLLPDARRIISKRKRNETTKSFEDLLAEIMGFYGDRHITHRLVQALDMRFYLRILLKYCSEEYFDKGSNYSDLIHKLMNIQDEGIEITFATFNYDILIEKALQDVRLAPRTSSIHDYVSWKIPLIKLHGSIDWVYEIYLKEKSLNKADITRNLATEDAYKEIQRKIEQRAIKMNAGDLKPFLPTHLPAIAIPLTDKRSFECPKDHERLLEQRLKSAANIVVIGWKAGDRHLLETMKKCCSDSNPHLIVISNTKEGAEGIVDTIKSESFSPRSARAISGGFSTFLDDHDGARLDALLSQSHAIGPHIEAKPYK